jgi:hypothetical protein
VKLVEKWKIGMMNWLYDLYSVLGLAACALRQFESDFWVYTSLWSCLQVKHLHMIMIFFLLIMQLWATVIRSLITR